VIRHALIVEDQDTARDWMEEALKGAFPGVVVEAAASCAAAGRLLARQQFDLALVDLGLPDGSGLSVLAQLGDATIRIVATMFEDDEHLYAALRIGVQGYILKDQAQEEMGELLAGIAAGKPPLSGAVARRLLSHFHAAPPAEDPLTAREREVLTLIAKGLTLPKTAELLGISHNTAAGYTKEIYRKLKVNTRAEAVLEAARRGLIVP